MKYRVVLIESEEGYAVSCPALRGCHSQGTTLEEALANIKEAIREWLAVDRGQPIAKITSYNPAELTDDQAMAELVRSGLADPPEAPLDVDGFLATPRPRLADGLSVSELVAKEREEGRRPDVGG